MNFWPYLLNGVAFSKKKHRFFEMYRCFFRIERDLFILLFDFD